jgi:hypothetical protein
MRALVLAVLLSAACATLPPPAPLTAPDEGPLLEELEAGAAGAVEGRIEAVRDGSIDLASYVNSKRIVTLALGPRAAVFHGDTLLAPAVLHAGHDVRVLLDDAGQVVAVALVDPPEARAREKRLAAEARTER